MKTIGAKHFSGLAKSLLLTVAALGPIAGGTPSLAQSDNGTASHDTVDGIAVLREETDVFLSSQFDGSWSRVYGGGIGNDAVPYVGFIDAIDVASRNDFELCFPVEAKTIFLDADTSPREISDLPSAIAYDVGGFAWTCARVEGAGTVVLVTPGSHRRLTSEAWLADNVGNWTGKFAGAIAGGIAGAKTGAVVGGATGSVVFPVVGTVKGVVIGTVVGGVAGMIVGDATQEYIGRPVGEAIVSGGFWVYDLAGDAIEGYDPCIITPSANLYVREEPWGEIIGVLDPETTVHPAAFFFDEGGGTWFWVFGAYNEDAQDLGIFYIYARWVEKKGTCVPEDLEE